MTIIYYLSKMVMFILYYLYSNIKEVMRKTIADIVSEASSVACWVYVQKYVKQKTLDEMLQEWSGASQFIIVMNTWFERLMAE